MNPEKYLSLAMEIDRSIGGDFWLCKDLSDHKYLELFRPDPDQMPDECTGWFNTSFCDKWTKRGQVKGNKLRILALLFMYEMAKNP